MFTKGFVAAALASAVSAQSLTDVLGSIPDVSNLTTYLGLYPNIESMISGLNNVTLLAPSNRAFATALNSSTGAAINANQTDVINAILSYHVLNGSYSNFSTMPHFVQTQLMPGMFANVTGGQYVEVIGRNMSTNSSMSANMTNNSTTPLFGEAYSGLLQNSSIVSNGTKFNGGVIHVIDHFLDMPSNITDTAVQLNLRSAVGALQIAMLADTIDTMMDVTCFIPTDAAFQAVGASLATMSPTDLATILKYHVINGTVGYSTMLKNDTTLTTLDGTNMRVEIFNGTVFVNSARVVVPNVPVANGVVHVIDQVLNPMNATAVPQPTATSQSAAFSGASSASGTPFTSGVASATTSVNTMGPSSAAAAATGGSGGSGSSSSSKGAAMPMKSGAMGAAALFGAGAAILNL